MEDYRLDIIIDQGAVATQSPLIFGFTLIGRHYARNISAPPGRFRDDEARCHNAEEMQKIIIRSARLSASKLIWPCHSRVAMRIQRAAPANNLLRWVRTIQVKRRQNHCRLASRASPAQRSIMRFDQWDKRIMKLSP